MDVRAIDHVNLSIPESRVDDAVAFYRDSLGFGMEDLEAYRAGERPLFTARLGETCVIHFSPVDDAEFEPPAGANFSHVCLIVESDVEGIRDLAEREGVPVERESTPLGATGRNGALYVTDPFGYTLELKAAR
jgi:catechol 2,3-dioxygenase-like lactoylglutathione lyase family enzyme